MYRHFSICYDVAYCTGKTLRDMKDKEKVKVKGTC